MLEKDVPIEVPKLVSEHGYLPRFIFKKHKSPNKIKNVSPYTYKRYPHKFKSDSTHVHPVHLFVYFFHIIYYALYTFQ